MNRSQTPVCLNRRHFVSTALGAVMNFHLTNCSAVPSLSEGSIDAHVHVWTPDVKKYPLAAGFAKQDMAPMSFTPDELFAQCRPEGVARIALIQMSYYGFDNRYMLDSMAAHPGVFSGVAIVDENSGNVRGQMKDLAKQGVRGFRLNPGSQSVEAWLSSPGMHEMWKVGAEEGISMCLLINPEALAVVDKMCVKHPETPVVIDHFARIGMAGPVSRPLLDRLLHLSTHAKVHVKTSAFYALGQKRAPYLDMGPMIRELRDAYGAERLMWASDCPFQADGGHTYRDSIALIRDRLDFLSASDKSWMLRKTAEKVFFS